MLTLVDACELEKAHESDSAKAETIFDRAHTELGRIDRRNLTLRGQLEQERAIKDKALAAIGELRQNAYTRAKQAREMTARFEPAQYRREALSTSAAMVAPLVTVLKSLPTAELEHYLKQMVAEDNIVGAEAIRVEFFSRQDRHDERDGVTTTRRFADIFARLKMPDAAEARERLARVAAAPQVLESRITEMSTGRRDPAVKLRAYRSERAV